MARSFDLVVVGTGVAATTVAWPCHAAGWSVALIDSRPFGGTCALRGCDPKKVLVGVSGVLDSVRRMRGLGLQVDNARIDWPELIAFKRKFTDPVPAEREKSFAESGMVGYHGVARFVSPDALEVNGERLEAKHFAICSGSAPGALGIPGEHHLITSDDFLELEQLPESLVFVGGGYIAFEFAHLAARAGAKVTILHRGKRPLEHFDSTLVDMLVAETRRMGIDVRLGSAVVGIDQVAGGFRVRTADGEASAACVVHAAGRVPNLKDLNLEAAHVESSRAGVKVNRFLASDSNPRVYAAGDSADSGGPQLTPIAGYEGGIVADNLLRGNTRTADYRGCASTVFTIPPMSSVGLTEEAARAQNIDFDVHSGDASHWYSSRRIAEQCAGYKVLVEKGTDRIVGAHLLGDSSEEQINIFALAIRSGIPAPIVHETLYAYPTHGSNTQYML